MDINVDIQLVFEYGYQWFCKNGIYVKGFAFDKENVLRKGLSLVQYYADVSSESDFLDKTKSLNGQFSIIYYKSNRLYLGVDQCRNFPLFYHKKGKNIYISDSVAILVDKDFRWAELQKKEFLCTGFVTNKFTLVTDVFQVQGGSIVSFSDGNFTEIFYHHLTKQAENINSLEHVFEHISQRLLTFLNGRTAVIPLSGGYDSRLIASMLKKNDYKNVICYSYGIPSSEEVKISKNVASKLGFAWIFIPCDEKRMLEFPDSEKFKEYYLYASNYVSGFYTQEYFAVNYLKQYSIVPKDSIFIPGHSGDMLSGSHLFKGIDDNNLLELIYKKHYNLKKEPFDIFKEHIALGLQNVKPFENFDNWNLKERQSKFIVNSCRMYEYFGYEYYLPLWDQELVFFFENTGFEQRLFQKLYIETLFKYYFNPMNVSVRKISPNMLNITYIINGIIRRIKRIIYTDDLNCKLVSKKLKKHTPIDIKWDSVIININSIQASWYIKQLENQKKK